MVYYGDEAMEAARLVRSKIRGEILKIDTLVDELKEKVRFYENSGVSGSVEADFRMVGNLLEATGTILDVARKKI